ncbi:MAG: beta-glucosidase family protein [Promethearchaeota archaeon]
MSETMNYEAQINDLLSQLTIEEKISLLTRHTGFSTKPIKRLGIKEFQMADGPHGIRTKEKNTYFPSAICLAASWNRDLAFQYGQALAEEAIAVERRCILAPGINIHRTPLCGRNFEYFTEDPYLNSQMVVPLIKGIQSKRIAACVKHYVCNNAEKRRRFSNSIVDERALEEIYFPGFKAAISEGNVWMVMGAYNKVNGHYVYSNNYLLTEKLREQWGFQGFVVSDWLATHSERDPAACINAGFTLEMPKQFVYEPEAVLNAFKKKEFTEETLDEHIRRLLRVQFYAGLYDKKEDLPKGSRNTRAHTDLAVKIIEEGSVLLKNDNNVLPLSLDKIQKICIKGQMADYQPRIKSIGGSSAVHPPFCETPLDVLKRELQNKVQIVKHPEGADVVLIFTGITHWFKGDSEGTDKETIILNKRKIKEIKEISKKNKNIIVVLYNGGPLAMSQWIDDVRAILEVWQPHQMGAQAIFNLLFGYGCPSGKLPATFPQALNDCPAHKSEQTYPSFHYSYRDNIRHEILYVNPKKAYKASPIDIYYREGIYVGYRYFDKKNIEPLFSFGFGLSYTKFEYFNLKLPKTEFASGENIIINIDIKNIGSYAGSEIIQVYANDVQSSIDRPVKELVGFTKVFLKPGEQKTAEIQIKSDELAFFNPNSHKWVLEPGVFRLLIGASSRDIKSEGEITIK